MNIRLATANDAAMVFHWRNDPVAISASKSQAGIDWETHQEWFPAQLSSLGVFCFIFETDDTPCGVIWFRRNQNDSWNISINIARGYRGKGIGSAILQLGISQIERMTGMSAFSAEVRSQNFVSSRLFERFGFVLQAEIGDIRFYLMKKKALPVPQFEMLSSSASAARHHFGT